MTGVLAGEPERAQKAAQAIQAIQERLSAAKNPDKTTSSTQISQLSPKLALLVAFLERAPAIRKQRLEKLDDSKPGPQVERQLRHDLREHPAAQIQRLRSEDRFNRFAGGFNYTTHLASNIVFLDVPGLARRFIDLFFIGESLTALTPRNRQALDLYDRRENEFMRPPEPTDPAWSADVRRAEREELVPLAGYAEELRERSHERALLELLAEGHWHLEHERWVEAHAAFVRAQELDPENTQARQGALEASRQISAPTRAQTRAVQLERETPPADTAEAQALRHLTQTVCHTPLSEAIATAADFQSRYPHSAYADDAAFTEMALRDLTTHTLEQKTDPTTTTRQQALRAALERPDTRESNAARLRRALEESPWTNARIEVERQTSRKTADIRRYILLGVKPDQDAPQIITFQDRLHRYTDSLGILWPVQWVINSARCAFGKPVPDDPWRETSAAYLRRQNAFQQNPAACPLPVESSPEADRELGLDLAQSYEKMDRFDDALAWHKQALGQDDPQYAADLNEKEAHRRLTLARLQTDPVKKREILERLVKDYAATNAGRRAQADLEKLDADKPDPNSPDFDEKAPAWSLLNLSKRDLASWPDLWFKRGLGLDPNWFDEKVENGELKDDGVHVLRPDGHTLVFTLRYSDKPNERKIMQIKPEEYAKLDPILKAWKRENQARERAQALLEGRPFPLELDASAGPGGFDMYPRLIPLPFNPEELPLYK
jgi:tetratricopeptide (TPR) repeat protein